LKKVAFKKYNKKDNEMPCGHFQSMEYSLIFDLLTQKRLNWVLIGFLFIAFCTFYNRITYKYHSIFKIISGTIIGILFCYAFLQIIFILFYIKK